MDRTSEIGNGDQAVGAGIGVDEFGGRIARPQLITRVHGGVVEEEHHVVGMRSCRRGIFGLEGKALQGLFLVVLPDAEIFQGEILDVVSFLIGYHRIDEDEAGFRFDRGWTSGRGLRGGFLRMRAGRSIQEECNQSAGQQS
jgi:hypothetical protein